MLVRIRHAFGPRVMVLRRPRNVRSLVESDLTILRSPQSYRLKPRRLATRFDACNDARTSVPAEGAGPDFFLL
jgi:hypothetical protein